jgi:hypothetical protein
VSNENAPALLDREGIFRVKPFDWSIQPSGSSKAIAVSVGCVVTAQYDAGEWVSWTEYEPYQVRGWWYVIGKDGRVNQKAVDQLALSLGWDGDLRTIRNSNPPDIEVKVTVKANVYNEKTTYKATWMNPGDYTPEPSGASDEDVSKLVVQFGSLLRAAAAASKKTAGKTTPPVKAKTKTSPDPIIAPVDMDDVTSDPWG